MAEFNATTIRTTRAFFVDGNGIRRYCDTAIKTLGSDVLELVTSNNYCIEHTWRFLSLDGFYYKAMVMVGEHKYSISLRLFMRGASVLLYGGWERLGVGAEMVIEGQVCGLIFQQNPDEKRDFLPAA